MVSPKDLEILSARAQLERTLYKPAANEGNGYFKPKYPPPPPLVAPKAVNDNGVLREFRLNQGFNTARPLQNNPNIDRSLIPGQKISPGGGGANPLAPRSPNFFERGINRLVGDGPATQLGNRNPISAPPIAGPLSSRIARNLKGVLDPRALGPGLLNPIVGDQINQFHEQGRKNLEELLKTAGFPPNWANGISRYADTLNKIGHGGEYSPEHQALNPTLAQKALDFGKWAAEKAGYGDAMRKAEKQTRDMGIPDWLNPFKRFEPDHQDNPSDGKPNAESKAWFPVETLIKFYSPNNRTYLTLQVLGYDITQGPRRDNSLNQVFLREGTDTYSIRWSFFKSITPLEVSHGAALIEPWTLEIIGPAPGRTPPNPSDPELPPGVDLPPPMRLFGPDDFLPPHQPSPTIAPTPFLDPPPFDPLKEEKKERDANPTAPIFPAFNPTETPKLPTIPDLSPTPPSFQPTTPQTPEQRLNDRGIFPARKADVTATISGSPLSPDKQIGGDPVRLHPLNPTPPKTKPKTDPLEEYKDSLAPLAPLALIPPLIFTRPTGPKGTIDPQTADDITKSKEPPKPPIGTKPKCQNGCMAGLEDGQQSILDKLGKVADAGLNVADLALLNTINTKLGNQVPGGISGFLGKFSEWFHLDRLLNVMTFIVTVQNAYFLCDSLKVVTLQMVADGLSVIGIKDKDGDPVQLNKIIDKQIDDLLKSILGTESLEGMKKEWKALNRIYQAGANIIYSVQNIGWSILSSLEIIGSWNAKIGNALKKYGVIGQRAMEWFNPNPNFHNKFFTNINNALNIVNNIDFVAQSILNGRQAVDEITKQSAELSKDLAEATNPNKPPEHKATAKAEADAKAHSSSPTPSEEHIRNL